MMATDVSPIARKQQAIIEDFALFPDWTEKYEYIVDLGRQLPPIPEQYKSDAYLVKGCQSKVWLHGEVRNGRLYLEADSDAIITKGIIALLIRVFSGQRTEDIANSDMHFLDAIGLKSHLSPTRSNGLVSMVNHIRSLATRHEAGSETGEGQRDEKKKRIIEELKKVYDPEIPVDIYELGLIYSVELDDNGKVHVVMTLTSPACPVAGSMPMEIQERLMDLEFVNEVDLQLVWDPPWNKDKMSDEARMALDMF
jgi:cysteine desulfuration protein SufE